MKQLLFPAFNIKFLLFLTILNLTINSIFAFSFNIPEPVFNLSKNQTPKRYCYIVNNKNELAAIEIQAISRIQDINGQETNETAKEKFLIAPSQLLLQPGEEKVISIFWRGQSTLKKEAAYRIVASELPVKFYDQNNTATNSQGAKINVLLKYATAIYVKPEGSKSDIIVESAIPVTENKKQKLVVTLANQGTAHEVIRECGLVLTTPDKNKKVTIKPDLLKGNRNMLAGDRLKISLAWPQELPFSKINAQVFFKTIL